MPKSNGAVLDSFLTPEAMLTPGAAGALTMMITNSLGLSFAMPRALTALVLSFVFGLLVLVADKSVMVKAIFYILNSLVIFCVAAGVNGFGATQQRVSLNLVTPAIAQTSSVDWQSKYRALSDQSDELSKKIEEAKSNSTSKTQVLDLVDKRDVVDKQKQELLDSVLKSKTGISVQDISNDAADKWVEGPGRAIEGGAHSVGRTNDFFAPWKFRW